MLNHTLEECPNMIKKACFFPQQGKKKSTGTPLDEKSHITKLQSKYKISNIWYGF